MSHSLDLFRTAGAMARHAADRQVIVARNIAQADTPGYRAQDIAPFAETYAAPAPGLRRSRPGHQAGAPMARSAVRPAQGEPAPNGNNVALEDEMLASVAATRDHNTALAIYRHGLTVLRSSLGRG